YGNAYFTINYLFKRTDAASASAPPGQLAEPGPQFFGTNQNRFEALFRGLNAALGTPDLNGNGIPDGSEEQILNCINSTIPKTTGFANGTNPFGNVPITTPGAGEIIFDPRLAQAATLQP